MGIAVRRLHRATEAGTQATGHVGLQGDLALDAGGKALGRGNTHHGIGATDIDPAHPGQDLVEQVGDKTVVAKGAVVRGRAHVIAEAEEVIGQQGQFLLARGAKKDRVEFRQPGVLKEPLAEKVKRRNAHAAADQADRVLPLQPEAPAKGPQQVDPAAGPETGKATCSLPHHLEQELQVTAGRDLVNGKGPAQKGIVGIVRADHDKLARMGAAGNQGRVQGEAEDPGRQFLPVENLCFFLELGHGKVYKKIRLYGLISRSKDYLSPEMSLQHLLLFASFLLGAVIGSFLNVVIFRLPDPASSIAFPPSHCPRCSTPIRWYDNIPMLSYLLLRGRCRACRQPISPRYPLVELCMACLSMALYARFGPGLAFVCYFPFLAALLAIIFIDIDHQIIPDVISLPGIVLGFAGSFFNPLVSWQQSALGILIGGGLLYTIALAYMLLTRREGMGGGDIKLLAMIGAFLGWQSLLYVIFASSLIGSVVGIAVMRIQGKGSRTRIPFGPFLALAAMSYLFFQQDIMALWQAYLAGVGRG